MGEAYFPYGLRVVGGPHQLRTLVCWDEVYRAHAAVDPRTEPRSESYMSAFRFDCSMAEHLQGSGGSVAGYSGSVWTPWLWFDLDNDHDLDAALGDARRLTASALERYRELDESEMLVFFSGKKGVHVGIPLPPDAKPSPSCHLACRRMAESLAGVAGITMDTNIYDRVRLFRSPNSRHPKSGLYKVWLAFDELMALNADGVRALAATPRPFDAEPPPPSVPGALIEDWQVAVREAEQVAKQRAVRREAEIANGGPERLQRDTLAFIADPPPEGERTVRLFRAAGNLREFGASDRLVTALLEDAALDTGLPPSEVRRVIQCGICATDQQRVRAKPEGGTDGH